MCQLFKLFESVARFRGLKFDLQVAPYTSISLAVCFEDHQAIRKKTTVLQGAQKSIRYIRLYHCVEITERTLREINVEFAIAVSYWLHKPIQKQYGRYLQICETVVNNRAITLVDSKSMW